MDISSKIHTLDYIVVAVYVVSVMAIGFYVSFRKGHTEDIFLAGRSLGWFNIGLSIFGTNVSPLHFAQAELNDFLKYDSEVSFADNDYLSQGNRKRNRVASRCV